MSNSILLSVERGVRSADIRKVLEECPISIFAFNVHEADVVDGMTQEDFPGYDCMVSIFLRGASVGKEVAIRDHLRSALLCNVDFDSDLESCLDAASA